VADDVACRCRSDNIVALGPGVSIANLVEANGGRFASATRAAAAGGNTTILPFALQIKGSSLRACVEAYLKLAEGECYIDTSFHLIISRRPSFSVRNCRRWPAKC
jgi:hypothetical protein